MKKKRVFVVVIDSLGVGYEEHSKEYGDEGNVSVVGCSFVNCTAVEGGAIYFGGSGSVGNVSGCSFVNCSANYGSKHSSDFGNGCVISGLTLPCVAILK